MKAKTEMRIRKIQLLDPKERPGHLQVLIDLTGISDPSISGAARKKLASDGPMPLHDILRSAEISTEGVMARLAALEL